MQNGCIYPQVILQMYMNALSCQQLSQRAGIGYATLRRKLRGESGLLLEDALRIREGLGCGEMRLEDLFEKRKGRA